MTSWPIPWLGTSLSPDASSWRTMPLTMRSIRSSSTGRLRMAMRMERASLSRSNGTRGPADFSTASSRSCPRSTVVNRWPQLPQSRRRRMAEPSSAGRLSLTWVSSCPQNGQRIRSYPLCLREGDVRVSAGASALTQSSPGGRGQIGWLGSTAQTGAVDREAGAHGLDPGGDVAFGRVVGAVVGPGETVQHLADHDADLADLAGPEPA